MKCRVLIPMRKVGGGWHLPGDVWDAAGAEFPEQVLHCVRVGCCEPADEECEQAHGLTPQQMAEAQLGAKAAAAGIWPEDMERFRSGVIAGYDMDGNEIPGPNYEPDEPEEEEETYPEGSGVTYA
jgi:hypothetical protein